MSGTIPSAFIGSAYLSSCDISSKSDICIDVGSIFPATCGLRPRGCVSLTTACIFSLICSTATNDHETSEDTTTTQLASDEVTSSVGAIGPGGSSGDGSSDFAFGPETSEQATDSMISSDSSSVTRDHAEFKVTTSISAFVATTDGFESSQADVMSSQDCSSYAPLSAQSTTEVHTNAI